MPTAADALLLSVVQQLEHSQWWPEAELAKHQLRQLSELLGHATRTVPAYREHPSSVSDLGELARLPIVERSTLQESLSDFETSALPASHAPATEVRTSGSTGRPVRVQSTVVGKLFHGALGVRYHLWHGRDVGAKLAALRRVYHKPGDPGRPQPWVPGLSSGPMVSLDVGTVVPEQLAWLEHERPRYVLTYPSNLRALLRESRARGRRIEGLHHVLSYGEVLDPDVRDLCEDVWGVPVVDAYSAQEIGAIALQCPDHRHYHVQGEDVLVEVIDDVGAPCPPGQLGRVVLTDLHNFATPLIRYAIGDYAELGEPCECGRGLPVLRRIAGRTRSMLTLRSGEQICPRFLTEEFAFELGIRQMQVVQRSRERVDVLVATSEPLTDERRARLIDSIRGTLVDEFELVVQAVDEIACEASGKFEEFKSELA